jgi:sigma-B regulation protein RsbU (phosphoserine phosphatase)
MYYEPAWQDVLIGGDFYDVFPLRDGSIALVVGDVTGKGLEAAAFTAEVKFALRAYLREDSDPGATLGRLNRFLVDAQTLDRRDGSALVCLSLAVVDSEAGKAQIAVAGAEPPLLLRAPTMPDNTVTGEEIWSHGLLLGIERDAVYQTTTRNMNYGDVLLMTTDGVTEARRTTSQTPSGVITTTALFGYEGFQRLAEESAAKFLYAPDKEPDLDAVGEAIALAARQFALGALQDDICLLLAQCRRHPDPTP